MMRCLRGKKINWKKKTFLFFLPLPVSFPFFHSEDKGEKNAWWVPLLLVCVLHFICVLFLFENRLETLFNGEYNRRGEASSGAM